MPNCTASSVDYLGQAQELLPPGPAWPRESDATLTKLLDGLSVEHARIHNRDCDLLSEMIPLTTVQMLADWERVTGLPDDCEFDVSTVDARRNAVLTKLRAKGGASPGYFVELAATFGYDIEITEFRPFRVGLNSIGDALTNGNWIYAIQVTSATDTIQVMRAGVGAVGEPLRYWGNEPLECLISKYAPAHTTQIFAYAGAAVET